MAAKSRPRRSQVRKDNGAGTTPASTGTIGDALITLERERQAAAIFKFVAEHAIASFAPDHGSPRLMLTGPDRTTFHADIDIVLDVAGVIHQLAHDSRKRMEELLRLPVKGIQPGQKNNGGGEQKEEQQSETRRLQLKVVDNPARKNNPPRAVA